MHSLRFQSFRHTSGISLGFSLKLQSVDFLCDHSVIQVIVNFISFPCYYETVAHKHSDHHSDPWPSVLSTKTNSDSFVNTQQTLLDLHLIWVDSDTPWDQGPFKNSTTMLVKLCQYCFLSWSTDNWENMFTPSDSLSQLLHEKSSAQTAIKEKGLFLWWAVKISCMQSGQ